MAFEARRANEQATRASPSMVPRSPQRTALAFPHTDAQTASAGSTARAAAVDEQENADPVIAEPELAALGGVHAQHKALRALTHVLADCPKFSNQQSGKADSDRSHHAAALPGNLSMPTPPSLLFTNALNSDAEIARAQASMDQVVAPAAGIRPMIKP